MMTRTRLLALSIPLYLFYFHIPLVTGFFICFCNSSFHKVKIPIELIQQKRSSGGRWRKTFENNIVFGIKVQLFWSTERREILKFNYSKFSLSLFPLKLKFFCRQYKTPHIWVVKKGPFCLILFGRICNAFNVGGSSVCIFTTRTRKIFTFSS